MIQNTSFLNSSCSPSVSQFDEPFLREGFRLQAPNDLPVVLLIDDDCDQRLLFSTVIQGAGYRVIAAGDAEEALDILWKERIDCVVCDVFLPKTTGVEFLQIVRLSHRFSRVSIVMLTASREDMELDLLSAGADLFCTKDKALSLLPCQLALLLS